jgi:two-component system chemotaxis sensor kinase CheA
MDDDLTQYRELYAQEAAQHLAALQDSIRSLEADPAERRALEAARIAAHSLKGISLTMHYEEPASLASGIEAHLSLVLDGSATPDVGQLSTSLEQLVAAVEAALS